MTPGNLTGGSTPYSHSFAFNTLGNLTSKAGVALGYAAQSGTCPDGALSKPHAATTAGSDAYCYDKNGNMVKRTESGTTYTQNFDTENQLISVVTGGQTTTFVYDGDGRLTKKVKLDGTYTLYLGIYEIDLSSGGAVTKKTSYYPGGAMRVDIVGGSNTLYYLLKDHLGSASVLLDSTGVLVTNGEQRYYPFGENRITSFDLKTDHLFTGQLSVGLGGIYSYGARFYSPRLGRFLSADTIVPNFADPQSLNRYSYVLNSPLKYIDPTGHASVCGSAYSDPECPTSGGNNGGVDSGGTGNGGSSSSNNNQPVPDAGVNNNPPFAPPLETTNVSGDFNEDTHPGIDYSPPDNPWIQASGNGTVVITDSCDNCTGIGLGNTGAAFSRGYGNVIVVEHPFAFLSEDVIRAANLKAGQSLFLLYAHMADHPQLQPGDPVFGGQILGEVGDTGNSSGAHLHFEVRVGNTGSLDFGTMCGDGGNPCAAPNGQFNNWYNSGNYTPIDPSTAGLFDVRFPLVVNDPR